MLKSSIIVKEPRSTKGGTHSQLHYVDNTLRTIIIDLVLFKRSHSSLDSVLSATNPPDRLLLMGSAVGTSTVGCPSSHEKHRELALRMDLALFDPYGT